MSRYAIIWFRQDLRLDDNPALAAAIGRGTVVPVFIWRPDVEGAWAPGAAGRWWLHHALADLSRQIAERGGRLILRRGEPLEVLRSIARVSGVEAVYWNRRYEPAAIEHDSEVKAALREEGLEVKTFNASLLFEPWDIASGSGGPYRVFTPFSRNLFKQSMVRPVEIEYDRLVFAAEGVDSVELDALELLPKRSWDGGLYQAWNPTRSGGWALIDRFLSGEISTYDETRDIPGEDGTSRLSPYLHWGQMGPREIMAAIGAKQHTPGGRIFFKQLLWREFAYHILFHFPDTPTVPLQAAYAGFPWAPDEVAVTAWGKGSTGYPIVDAGMRQLWATGWMHNRVRMVVASLLVKHLLQPWQSGARWFWDTLVDADLANNSLSWQWAGGCGADAAPYFRIFNPMTQGKKFDPQGVYVRRWVPELARLPDRYIHQPWEAPVEVREACGVYLGENYPRPLIEHEVGRKRALAALSVMKERRHG